jgi:hypothetical protein
MADSQAYCMAETGTCKTGLRDTGMGVVGLTMGFIKFRLSVETSQ